MENTYTVLRTNEIADFKQQILDQRGEIGLSICSHAIAVRCYDGKNTFTTQPLYLTPSELKKTYSSGKLAVKRQQELYYS